MEISYEKEKQTSKDKKSSSILLRRKSGSFKAVCNMVSYYFKNMQNLFYFRNLIIFVKDITL